jgi:3-phosphoshikimate 1-carboxyvinyltransferase
MISDPAALPDPYVIRPFAGPVNSNVPIPGSKSITNRALLCAALATGTSQLYGVLLADDTEAMIGCIRALGATVLVDHENHTHSVTGVGGIWNPGPITVNARMSGTTARFIAPSLLQGSGEYVLEALESMRERPMGDLIAALEQVGAAVDARAGGVLPLRVQGGATSGHPVLQVAGDVSSQFLSGLLLNAPSWTEGGTIEVAGELVSRPYVDMTISVMRQFGATVDEPTAGSFLVAPGGYSARTFRIEPDASAASYAFGAAVITGGTVTVTGLGSNSTQGDVRFAHILGQMGAEIQMGKDLTTVTAGPDLRGVAVDMADCSDTAQTLAVVAAFADGPTTVNGIGFIRNKETNRVAAVVAELNRCGIRADEHSDGFTVYPGTVQPAVIQTYRDHRMAMAFSLLGLRAEGIQIADPGCVAKTFPDFFEVLESMRPVPQS